MKSYNLPMDSPLLHPPCVILLTFGLNKYNLFRINWFFFSFIICLDEKFRKELHQKHYLAVMNAFLRKLSFLRFTVKILLVSYPSSVFLYEMFKTVGLFLCYGNVSTMWDILYLLMYAKLSFFLQDWDKKGFSYCESAKQLP